MISAARCKAFAAALFRDITNPTPVKTKIRWLKDSFRGTDGFEDSQPWAFLTAYSSHCGQTGMLAADDLTASLVFLMSDGARHITGQNLIVDDGFTL